MQDVCCLESFQNIQFFQRKKEVENCFFGNLFFNEMQQRLKVNVCIVYLMVFFISYNFIISGVLVFLNIIIYVYII